MDNPFPKDQLRVMAAVIANLKTDTVITPMSQVEIGELLGMSKDRVSKAAKELQNREIIYYNKKGHFWETDPRFAMNGFPRI